MNRNVAGRQNPFANAFAFAVLENDVNPERDYGCQDDCEDEKQNDDGEKCLEVSIAHGL